MSVNWSDFIAHANHVLTQATVSDSEIEYRSCMRLAYYGCYHRALTLVKLGEIPNYAMGDHQKLAVHLQESLHLANTSDRELKLLLRRIGLALNQVKCARHDADYNLESTLTRESAELQISNVNRIISICNTADNMSTRAA